MSTPLNAIASTENAEIRGTQWNDRDEDGVRNADEPGLVDWTVFLEHAPKRLLDSGETSTTTEAKVVPN